MANDIVYTFTADTQQFEKNVLAAASSAVNLDNATKGDFASGLVRGLEKAQQEAQLLTKQITQVDIEVSKFQRKGASDEMVAVYRKQRAEVEALRKAEIDAAEKKAQAEKAAKEKAAIAAAQQLQAIEQGQTRQARIDEANVQRQVDLQRQASQVRSSILTRDQALAREVARLQDLNNRGLINEIELQKAVGIARLNARRMTGAGAGVAAGFIAQQGAIGLQDAVTGYQTNGWAGAMMAGSNNIVQMASLANPMIGTAAALGVAAVQLGLAWAKSKDGAEEAKKAFEKAQEAAERAAEKTSEMYARVVSTGEGKFEADLLSAADRKSAEVKRLQAVQSRIDGEIQWSFANEGETEAGKANRKALEEQRAKAQEQVQWATRERDVFLNDARNAPVGPRDVAGLTREENEEARKNQEAIDRRFKETSAERKKQEEEMLEILRQEQEVQRQIAQQKEEEAKAVKDSLMTQEERANKRADRLLLLESEGRLSRSDVVGAMRQQVGGMFAPPSIAQGLVKGSVEEVRARRMDEAKSEQRQMIDKQVETTLAIREQTVVMREFKNKYEAPETGSEA